MMVGCACEYGCRTDSDCAAGSLCLCGGIIGTCVAADCTTDADCQPGSHCASYDAFMCNTVGGFACQTAADECVSRNDCAGMGACLLDSASTSRSCSYCAIP
jgi:hypothetical protein